MAIESQGTVVAISNEDSEVTSYATATFAAIGEVKTFGGPNGSAAVIDASHLGSTRREKLMGLPDEGQITLGFSRVFDDLGQIEAREARSTRQQRWLKLTYSDGTIEYGAGYVLDLSSSGGVDALVDGSLTFEITGEWLEAA